jgi:hypothetical protein
MQPGEKSYVALVKKAYEESAKAGKLLFKNSLYVPRGMYDVVAVMDENNDQSAFVVKGPVIDLFDPTLPVLASKSVAPGKQALLLNVARVKEPGKPQVLAAAARIYNEERKAGTYSFVAKSPAKTVNAMRILLPAAPKGTVLYGPGGEKITPASTSWDESSKTVFLQFDNSPDGVRVEISY